MDQTPQGNSAILLIHCPDRTGIVAAVSGFLAERGANILHADQHVDHDARLFFMRVDWDMKAFTLDEARFRSEFTPLADSFRMQWNLNYPSAQRVAIFVSKYQHCLLDLLYRHQIGELPCSVECVVSNHEDAAELARFYGVPFCFFPVKGGSKAEAERRQLAILQEKRIDLVVLARYMQVLSAEFLSHFPESVINVHHSFLPAFTGAKPYHAAHARGVKLIGATSHYVTEELDEGPIIEQDVARTSHRDQVEDLVRKGRDLERLVLSRAVKWHLEHRILRYAGKTVVFA